MNWQGLRTLVTGGASFIGSHLVDALVSRGAEVRVVDNLSSGRIENIEQHVNSGRIEFLNDDLLSPESFICRCRIVLEIFYGKLTANNVVEHMPTGALLCRRGEIKNKQ